MRLTPVLVLLAGCPQVKETGTASCEARTWCWDLDGDGHGDPMQPELYCDAPSSSLSMDCDDCDDQDPSAWPGAVERCNALDDDCDGVADEPDAEDAPTWYADGDGDGYGALDPGQPSCQEVPGSATISGDCDDGDPFAHPAAQETCDGSDDDCDGEVDEAAAVDAPTWYPDADGDGWGANGSGETACQAPPGFLAIDGDCDDASPSVHPGMAEICGNDVDDDCDGGVGSCGFPDGELLLGLSGSTFLGDVERQQVGSLVAGGDVDGDGLGDVVIGSTGGETATTDASLWVFSPVVPGSYSVSEARATLVLPDDGRTHPAITNVSVVGDGDGDGYEDLLVGVSGDDAMANNAGAAYLWRGPLSGLYEVGSSAAAVVGTDTLEQVGLATASAGDQDGDGLEDMLVGTGDGRVYVFSGPLVGTATPKDALATLIGNWGGTSLGTTGTLAGMGDVDGDGLDDVAAGAPHYTDDFLQQGAAYVFRGPLTGLRLTVDADAWFTGGGEDATGDEAGVLAGAGDVNGDGLDDLLVGGGNNRTASVDGGAAWLLTGPMTVSGDLADLATASLYGYNEGYRAGTTVAGGSDVDSDGFDDLLVGAPDADSWDIRNGVVYLFLGPASGTLNMDADASSRLLPDVGSEVWSSGAMAGNIATPGDTNGDGAADILVGGPMAWLDVSHCGLAWLVPGAVGW